MLEDALLKGFHKVTHNVRRLGEGRGIVARQLTEVQKFN